MFIPKLFVQGHRQFYKTSLTNFHVQTLNYTLYVSSSLELQKKIHVKLSRILPADLLLSHIKRKYVHVGEQYVTINNTYALKTTFYTVQL